MSINASRMKHCHIKTDSYQRSPFKLKWQGIFSLKLPIFGEGSIIWIFLVTASPRIDDSISGSTSARTLISISFSTLCQDLLQHECQQQCEYLCPCLELVPPCLCQFSTY